MPIEGFETRRIDVGEVALSVHLGGDGPPLVLLHGYPQNHRAWAKVAPRLAEDRRVIVPDLRGYGESDAPADDASHQTYSKRRMAADIVGLLDALGHGRADILGHDRGARVAYRLALDHPGRVSRLGIVEIVPTGAYWAAWDAETAMGAYHWTFLAQPPPLPETLIGADPASYLDATMSAWSATGLDPFPAEATASYRAQMADPARRAAMCADYRAGATTDRRLDDADRSAGRRIAAPTRVLIGGHGFPGRTGRAGAIWSDWATEVTVTTCDSGHFIPDETPEAVVAAFAPFFAPD